MKDKDKDMGDFKEWLARPADKHIVDFYSSEQGLVANILDYITHGIEGGDNCVAITSPTHIRMLDKAMAKYPLKSREQFRDDCRLLNVQSLLDQFMIDGLPNKKKFNEVMARILTKADKRNKPIRIYSELVAILLEENNSEGAMQLQKLLRQPSKSFKYSLYSAYPDNSHGVSGGDLHEMIKSYHDFSFGSHDNA